MHTDSCKLQRWTGRIGRSLVWAVRVAALTYIRRWIRRLIEWLL